MVLFILCVSLLFSIEESILYLSGASDMSQVGEQETERLFSLARRPLKVNHASETALSASGLFSAYQLASLKEYRVRYGDVLSPAELGAVDGFTADFVAHIAVFLDFEATGSGRDAWTSARGDPLRFAGLAGFGAKASEGKGYLRWMGKAAAEYGGFGASVAARSEWTSRLSLPGEAGWSVSYSGRRLTLIAGRYQARFGQGLLLWSGTSFGSFTTAQSMMKKPSGLTAYTSYSLSGTMYGAAARIALGRFSLSPFADAVSRSLGGHFAWNHRHGQFGATVLYGGRLMLSADFQHTFSGVTLFGELTSLRSGVLGARFTAGRVDAGARALYSRGEHSVAAAASCLSDNRIHSFGLSGSVAYKDSAGLVRSQATYSIAPDSTWSLGFRVDMKLKRAYARYELRSDGRWNFRGPWSINARLHLLHCVSWAWLAATEVGFKPSRFGLFLQAGIFRADNWDDRIYIYRRDMPGNYNVPAMYGRGWWVAQYAVLKLGGASGKSRPWGKLYLRTEFTAYPWARDGDTHRRPSAGAAIQMAVDLSYLRKTKNTAATRQPKAAR